MDAFLQPLLQHGVLGILCAILLYWVWTKDRQHTAELKAVSAELGAEQKARVDDAKAAFDELQAEQAARTADAQRYTQLALDLQAKAIDACATLKQNVQQFQNLSALLEQTVVIIKRLTRSTDARKD